MWEKSNSCGKYWKPPSGTGLTGAKGSWWPPKVVCRRILLVCGCADLKTALEGAHSVAVRCDTEVFVYDVGLGELSRLQKML